MKVGTVKLDVIYDHFKHKVIRAAKALTLVEYEDYTWFNNIHDFFRIYLNGCFSFTYTLYYGDKVHRIISVEGNSNSSMEYIIDLIAFHRGTIKHFYNNKLEHIKTLEYQYDRNDRVIKIYRVIK